MMPQDIATFLITVLGGAGGIGALFKTYLDYRSGKAKEEKEFNKETIESLKRARLNLEEMENQRNGWREYASLLRGRLFELGHEEHEIPQMPTCLMNKKED